MTIRTKAIIQSCFASLKSNAISDIFIYTKVDYYLNKILLVVFIATLIKHMANITIVSIIFIKVTKISSYFFIFLDKNI